MSSLGESTLRIDGPFWITYQMMCSSNLLGVSIQTVFRISTFASTLEGGPL